MLQSQELYTLDQVHKDLSAIMPLPEAEQRKRLDGYFLKADHMVGEDNTLLKRVVVGFERNYVQNQELIAGNQDLEAILAEVTQSLEEVKGKLDTANAELDVVRQDRERRKAREAEASYISDPWRPDQTRRV